MSSSAAPTETSYAIDPENPEWISAFPATLPLKELLKTNKDYKRKKLDKFGDLYEGGDRFKANIDQYLVKRQIEKDSVGGPRNGPLGAPATSDQLVSGDMSLDNQGNPGFAAATQSNDAGAKQWEARKERAFYVPHAANLIDHLNSATHHEDPEVRSDDEYIKSLNKNIDGEGTDLPSQTRDVLSDLLVYNRPFLSVFTPPTPGAKSLAQQRDMGGLDAHIGVIQSECVNDWEFKAGKYLWIRTYEASMARAQAWAQPTMEQHKWTYFTATEVVEYVLLCPVGEFEKQNQDLPVSAIAHQHGFGRLPVVPVKVHSGLWAMDRLADIALARFNRRSSITWFADLMAFCVLILSTEKDISALTLSDFGGLVLSQGDTAAFIAPPTAILDQLFKDDEALRGDMYEVLYAMSLTAANQPENARQSGEAKKVDREPLSMILRSCGAGLIRAYVEAFGIIADFRKTPEAQRPQFAGLSKFDAVGLKQFIDNNIALFGIAGYPAPAKSWSLRELALNACKNAPEDVKTKIEKWCDENLTDAKLAELAATNSENPKSVTIDKSTLES